MLHGNLPVHCGSELVFQKIHPDLSLRNSCPNHILLPDPVHPVQITDRFLHPISAQKYQTTGCGMRWSNPFYKTFHVSSGIQARYRLFRNTAHVSLPVLLHLLHFLSAMPVSKPENTAKAQALSFSGSSLPPLFSPHGGRFQRPLHIARQQRARLLFRSLFPRQEKFLSDC